jgi:hypothetical protein
MKKIMLLALLVVSCNLLAQGTDEEQVKQVVTSAYINGIQNRGNVEDIRNGFHASFNMLRLMDNDIKPLSIQEWITNIEKAKAKGDPAPPKAEGKFVNVDVTGNAAVVKLDLFREGKRTFTDYLVLYKFTEGWKIVSKTYFRHP